MCVPPDVVAVRDDMMARGRHVLFGSATQPSGVASEIP